MRNGYAVIFDRTPPVAGTVISTHRTLVGAARAYRRRNPYLFNLRRAERLGMVGAGTFDRVYEVKGDEKSPVSYSAIRKALGITE